MSDTHSVASTGDLSDSTPFFSANDRNVELVDPDFTPITPSDQLGSLPYSDSEPNNYLQLLETKPVISDSRSHPVSLDFLNSSPSLLYSFTDPSSTSTGEKSASGNNKTHSGITDSFGVSSDLYQPKLAKPWQLRSAVTSGTSRVSEDTDTAAPGRVGVVNHSKLPPNAVPLPNVKGASRDVTPTPESVLDSHLTETRDTKPAVGGVASSQAQTALTLPQESTTPLLGETTSVDSDPERIPVMDSDIETASVVSVQQLTDTYLNELPESLPDVTTPLSEGGKIPFAFPSSPSLSRALSSEPPKFATTPPRATATRDPSRAHSMLSQYDELSSPGRIPAHMNPSASRGPVLSPVNPYLSGQEPRLLRPAASMDENDVSAIPDTLGAESNLEEKLEEEKRSRVYLEGQLEAVQEEYEAALKERPKLLSKLSIAETELAEMAAALEKERMKHKLTPETSSEDVSATRHAANNLRDTKEALAQEQGAVADLKGRLQQTSRHLEKNLQDTKQSLKYQESDSAELRDRLQKAHAELTKKANKLEETAYQLSSLEASYDSLEQNKSWLHKQLQDAQKAKLKLQEELRESKTSAIAREIKCDQLQKENMAHQEQIGNLLQGVLQDKANMVSQLETVKEDVLSHEDLYAKMIAEKSKLEDMVKRKDEALSQLGSDTARVRAEREELEQKLGDAHSENEQLSSKNEEVERDNKRLSHKLGSVLRDLEEKGSDLEEVEKIKATLQEKLRNTDAEAVGKDGTIQSLKEANGLLQQELELVSDSRGSVEGELAELKRETAMLEAELNSALEKCKEKDSHLRRVLESRHSTDSQKQALCGLLEEKDKELEQKEEAIQSMETQMNELLKDFGSLQDNFKSIASESGSVNDSIAEKDRVISHLASEKDVRDEELHSLGKENEDFHDKLARLQHEKAHLLGQVEGSVSQAEYKKTLQDKAELQEELNSLRVDQKRDEIKAHAKINRLETDLKSAQKTASKAQKELKHFQDERNEDLRQSHDAKWKIEADFRAVNEKLQKAIEHKEKAENVLSSLKPSEQRLQGIVKSKCERLEKQNVDLTEQLQHMTQQKADIDRASGLVAAQLKQNADKEKRKLLEKNREVSLEMERLRGRLAGMHATLATLR